MILMIMHIMMVITRETHTHTYLCIYILIFICTDIHIHIHTYAHPPSLPHSFTHTCKSSTRGHLRGEEASLSHRLTLRPVSWSHSQKMQCLWKPHQFLLRYYISNTSAWATDQGRQNQCTFSFSDSWLTIFFFSNFCIHFYFSKE